MGGMAGQSGSDLHSISENAETNLDSDQIYKS